jgi:hypothetical protein
MTKKELEKKVADLEAKVAELTSALLALSLKQNPGYVFIPAPQPITLPTTPTWDPNRPYVGDPVYPYGPVTICSTNVCKQQEQNFQVVQ